MSDNWRQYTAEYMANEYRNDAASWKSKYEKVKVAIRDLINSMPKEQIVWYPDVQKKVDKIEEILEKDNNR
tara:strand:- start:842 stop:1054 length:213 start_codon:yes stop_codon:yes gene_type:complete